MLSMIFWPRSVKTAPRREVVIDIGSHAIKALLFEYDRSARGVRVTKKISTHLPLGIERLRVATALHELMFLMVRSSGVVPDRVTIAVGPHLADYTVETWRGVAPPQEAVVSYARLGNLFAGMVSAHQEQERVKFCFPLQLHARGYLIDADESESIKKGITFLPAPSADAEREIAVKTLILSFPRPLGDALEEARFSWGGMPTEFIPLAFAYQAGLDEVSGWPRAALIIDIGGEETTVVRREGGGVRSVRSFPGGVHGMIRVLAKERGVSFREAEDMVRHYTAGIARTEDGAKISAVMTRTSAAWIAAFIAALDEDYGEGPLSGDVMVTGGGGAIPEVRTALAGGDWLRRFSCVERPSVQMLTANNFFEGDSLGGFLNGPDDAGLAALIRYAAGRHNLFL